MENWHFFFMEKELLVKTICYEVRRLCLELVLVYKEFIFISLLDLTNKLSKNTVIFKES